MDKKTGRKGTPLAFLATLLLLGMAAALAGCGGKAALVGKWEVDKSSSDTYTYEKLEFSKDGTVIIENAIKCEWKTEKDQLTFTFSGDYPETYDYKISGSTLTLTDEDGDVAIYQKVKK